MEREEIERILGEIEFVIDYVEENVCGYEDLLKEVIERLEKGETFLLGRRRLLKRLKALLFLVEVINNTKIEQLSLFGCVGRS